MTLFLVLLLVVAPLVELYVIIQVAHVIGGWETIALLVIESMIGAWLLKLAGLSTLAKISRAVDEGRVPGKELVDGLLIIVAGALMLAPGFITDIFGYLLLIPPTRAPVRGVLLRRFRRGGAAARFFTSAGSRAGTVFVGSFRAGGAGGSGADDGVVDTSGHDTDTDAVAGRRRPLEP